MGFLNPDQDDDYRISQMAGTSEVPAVGALQGLMTAVPKGLTTAGLKVSSAAGDVLDDTPMAEGYRQFRSLTDEANDAMTGLGLPETLPIFDHATRAKAEAATQVVSDWAATGSDPRRTGVVGRIAADTTGGIAIGAAGAAVAGPWGAASLLGGTEGHSAYLEAKQNGLDDATATEQAGIAGLFSAASAFVPLKFGKTLARNVLGSASTNVGFGMAQRLAASSVLKANGYTGMASQYRVFDGEAIAADAILGHAFGVLGHAMGEHVNPADVDAASAVATEEHYNRSAPGVPTEPDVANAHAETMAESLNRMADGDLPNVHPDVAQKIMDGVLPDPIHAVDEPLHEAAHEMLPGYAEAIADVPRQELAPEEFATHALTTVETIRNDLKDYSVDTYGHGDVSGDRQHMPPPVPPEDPKAVLVDTVFESLGGGLLRDVGEAIRDRHIPQPTRVPQLPETRAPERMASADYVPLDDYHQSMLDHIVHNYGDEPYGGNPDNTIPMFDNFGRPTTVRQAAAFMALQRMESERFGALHEVVAACAVRNGV